MEQCARQKSEKVNDFCYLFNQFHYAECYSRYYYRQMNKEQASSNTKCSNSRFNWKFNDQQSFVHGTNNTERCEQTHWKGWFFFMSRFKYIQSKRILISERTHTYKLNCMEITRWWFSRSFISLYWLLRIACFWSVLCVFACVYLVYGQYAYEYISVSSTQRTSW